MSTHLPNRSAGFTLTELMVVLVIAAILASVAIPTYRKQVEKARKAEAKTNLSALALLLEQYNSLYGRYCPACTDAAAHTYQYKENANGVATTDQITSWLDFRPKQATDAGAVRFDYKIQATSNTSYTITATSVAGRGARKNWALTLTEDGTKTERDLAAGTSSAGWN